MTYWERRQRQLNEQMERDEEKLKKRLSSYFDTEYRKLENQIAAYYKRYGTDNVIQYRRLMEDLPEEDKRLLIEQMDVFAEKYPEYADLMPIRESIYNLNRLEGLQYSVRMQQLEIGAVENEQITAHLNRQAMRGVNAAADMMGFGKNFYSNNPDITKLFVNVPWSNGGNFSDRIWGNTSKLAEYLNTDIAQGLARGDSYDRLIKRLQKRFGDVSRKDAYRLIYTEGTYVMAEATIQPFTEDFEKYRLSTVGDGKACSICRGVAREVFDISDRQPGVNFPPLHPWCVIPDTKIIVPDIEAITKSWYSGDVIKITTANGGRLTVSPNHIVLTARGWVRAKHLIKGDKVVHYCRWRESLSESDPAHDNSVPTIEELFTSFVESGAVSPVSVPATSEDFKGDVVVNSKIDIINIDSKLRDKLNASFDEFIGDISFVGAPISSKVKLPAHSCLEFLLAGAGLTADGIMSGLGVAKVLLRGSFTHHELIGFRNPSDYNSRLLQSSSDSYSGNSKNLCDFVHAFARLIEFDDIVSIDIFPYVGHVYDASSLSTLYIANGIITSNCRCTFTIEVDDWDAWMDEYERRHGAVQAEQTAKRMGGGLMKIAVPDDVYKKSGMGRDAKDKIEQAIKKLESEYTIYLDSIEGGKMNRNDIFGSGGYIDEDGILKFALLFNYDIDYQRVERRMKYLYNKGEMAGKSFEDYIAHEIAHILPFQNCITEEDYRHVREELRTAFVAGVSGYADRMRDGAESLAEAFVKHRNGERIPDEADKLIRKYIYPWRK